MVDSKGRVWVGTVTGLAVYDGQEWDSRTFKPRVGTERAILGILGLSECGPERIAEGPPGTIWFGGPAGIWRHRDGRYEKISSEITSPLGMAADHSGALWAVTRYNVQRYDGKSWATVLCPYFANSIHRELPGLYGMAIGTNGNVYVGGTAYIEPTEPWTHEGTSWLVDQSRKQRNGGPPMAPLFEFDGQRWRAFGPPHGLGAKTRQSAVPELDGLGRMTAKASNGYYLLEGETWKRVNDSEASRGKRWVLGERKKGRLPGYAELLFRDGEELVEVRPVDHKTGKVLDLASEQFRSLDLAEDLSRNCVWLGTWHGLYRIWRSEQRQ
jgi:hypothetical protein